MEFLSGLKDMALGGLQVLEGVGKAAFAFLKFMLFAAVCVVEGIYSAVKGTFDFAKRAWNKLKKNRPGVKPASTGSATKKVLVKVLGGIKKEIADDTLKLSDLEKDEVLNDVKQIEHKIDNDEANGMHWVDGINEQGQQEVFDAELVKYDQLDADAQRRNETETSYIRNLA